MSSSETGTALAVNAELTASAAALAAKFEQALAKSETAGDEELGRLFAAAVRLNAAKHESGAHVRPFGETGFGITATDVMIATTAMLHAVNVQLFELGMWQAWTGAHALHRGEAA
jgi:hypothetical protein